MPPYRICCLTDYATLNYCLPEYVALLKTITFSPSVDGSSDNSSLPMSGKVARGARRMRRAINGFSRKRKSASIRAVTFTVRNNFG